MSLPDYALLDVVRELGLDVFGQRDARRQLEMHAWAGR